LAGGTEEGFKGVGRLDGGECDRRDKQPGVVVDEVQDLDLGAVWPSLKGVTYVTDSVRWVANR